MAKKIYENFIKKTVYLGKKFPIIKNDKANLVVFSFLFIIITSIVFSYNNSIKKKKIRGNRFFSFK